MLRWLGYLALLGAFVAATAAFWLLLAHLYELPDEQHVLRIDRVQRLVSDAREPSGLSDAGAVEISLPDDWLLEGVEAEDVWYRLVLDLNVPPDRLWGVLLTGVNLNGAVYLNGSAVGLEGSLEPLSQNWNRPLYFSIPSGLLVPGRNEVLVHVRSFPAGHGFLGPFFLGPREDLLPSYDGRFFLQVQVSQLITITTFTVGLLIGAIWFLRPQDTAYGWFSLANLFWAAHTLKFHVSDVPFSSLHWATYLFITAIGFGCAVVLFFRRVEGIRSAMEDRLVLGYFAGSAILLAVLGVQSSVAVYPMATLLVGGTFAFGAYGFVRLVRFAWTSRGADAWLYTAAGLFVLVFVLRDWLLIVGYMERTSGQYAIYAAPALLLVFGFVLIRRFVTALEESETLTRDLEARVAAKSADLERHHQRIRELERQQVLASERERIMRDMHDGVGGHLVASLALLNLKPGAESGVAPMLEAALTDLRLMIDSLDPIDGDLNLVLANLRQRTHDRLERAGLTVSWCIDELPALDRLTPDYALQVLRILQEAMANVVKHARASRLSIEAKVEDERTVIRVGDDGQGFAPSCNGGGRGLLNMQRRARSIGADLTISSTEDGTRVVLRLS